MSFFSSSLIHWNEAQSNENREGLIDASHAQALDTLRKKMDMNVVSQTEQSLREITDMQSIIASALGEQTEQIEHIDQNIEGKLSF